MVPAMMNKKFIAVIGVGQPSPQEAQLAEEVGRELAMRGAIIVCGGLGGVMEAACRGAKNEGGQTVGILPSDAKEHANEYVDIAIPTGLGYARNYLVAKTGDAVIAIDGSAGTLSEMAIAWFSNKPVISLVTPPALSNNGTACVRRHCRQALTVKLQGMKP